MRRKCTLRSCTDKDLYKDHIIQYYEPVHESAKQGSSLSEILSNHLFSYKMYFLFMRKRASPRSKISPEYYQYLSKRAKKVLKATPKVLADIRIMLKLSRESFYPSRQAHMNNVKFVPLSELAR